MGRQKEIPGTERISDPDLRAAAEAFEDAREDYNAAKTQLEEEQGQAKTDAHDALVQLLEQKKAKPNIPHVEPDGLTVTLEVTTTKRAVVRRPKDPTPRAELQAIPGGKEEG